MIEVREAPTKKDFRMVEITNFSLDVTSDIRIGQILDFSSKSVT